jgi:BirA family biotin operon repressor/biotin-[acetyl-CoA-carboxylase] ligase
MQETRRRVVAALRDGPVAGPELADALDVSRAAVWNHVEALRAEGFEIVDGPDGYEVTAVPEYGAGALAYELDGDVEFHEELASTNARARELAVAGAGETLVVAARQTGGRGRLDRAWDSPEGGIYASLLRRPAAPPAHVPVFTLAAAVAVADAARDAGVDAGIKWPNDVLVPVAPSNGRDGGPRKLAGVLTEMEGEADRVSWLVVGVGVNANTAPAALPETATSVAAEAGPVERRVFLASVVDRFRELVADPEAVLPAWRDRALTLGREVRVETPSGTVEGTAVDVEFPGTLLVETGEGTVRVAAGDCEHLRPR